MDTFLATDYRLVFHSGEMFWRRDKKSVHFFRLPLQLGATKTPNKNNKQEIHDQLDLLWFTHFELTDSVLLSNVAGQQSWPGRLDTT
jgi:hypothetical protein